MTLVNCTVVSTNNEVVHQWKISQVGDDKVSIRDFYHTTIEPIILCQILCMCSFVLCVLYFSCMRTVYICGHVVVCCVGMALIIGLSKGLLGYVIGNKLVSCIVHTEQCLCLPFRLMLHAPSRECNCFTTVPYQQLASEKVAITHQSNSDMVVKSCTACLPTVCDKCTYKWQEIGKPAEFPSTPVVFVREVGLYNCQVIAADCNLDSAIISVRILPVICSL